LHLERLWLPVLCTMSTLEILIGGAEKFVQNVVGSIPRDEAKEHSAILAVAPSMRSAIAALVAACVILGNELQAGQEISGEALVRQTHSEKRWEVGLETGCIFGLRNPNNYVILPQFLSIAWQPFPEWKIGSVRFRGQVVASFVGEAIVRGAESYFLGGALRFRLIFPLGTSRWAFYVDGGGGMGAVDSDDTPRGQGEDFTFCLLASGGARFALSNAWSLWAGFMWQHLSNAELSEPRRRNTSLDSIGPVIGASYAF
jgi:Lipid A 3-O-deacylase (PagL)